MKSAEEPAVTAYDDSGKLTHRGYVWLEGAKAVSIGDASMTKSGQLVIAGGTHDADGVIANFIGMPGKDGHLSQMVRTSPFLPAYICPADDGTVWSYGIDRDVNLRSVPGGSLLRPFSFTNGQVQAVNTSGLAQGWWRLLQGRHPGVVSLYCNSNTVTLYNDDAHQLARLDIGSGTLKIIDVVPRPEATDITGIALTSSGDLFASYLFPKRVPPVFGLFRLAVSNSGQGKWLMVGGTLGTQGGENGVAQLVGTDGDDLVYRRNTRGGAVFWSK
jgi:hypothetical protein